MIAWPETISPLLIEPTWGGWILTGNLWNKVNFLQSGFQIPVKLINFNNNPWTGPCTISSVCYSCLNLFWFCNYVFPFAEHILAWFLTEDRRIMCINWSIPQVSSSEQFNRCWQSHLKLIFTTCNQVCYEMIFQLLTINLQPVLNITLKWSLAQIEMQPIKCNSSFEQRTQKKSLRGHAFVYTVYSPYHYESKQVVLLKLDPLFCVYYRKGLHLYVV